MVLEEAAAGFLYSLKKQRSAACEAQPAKQGWSSVGYPLLTAVATIIDPVDGGRRKWSSSYMFCCEALLSAICTDMLAFCEGVNVFGGSCRPFHRIAEKAHSRKPSSRLLGARVQSKPNARANNRVIEEAHFEVAEVPLKRRIQRTTPDTGW